jgi:asparagine synthase (glutamine-hydrolysing)
MCGIAGAYSLGPGGQKYTSRISNAIACINHRGPDGDGIFTDDKVALGHKRLSIIDTSAIANQPMYSRSKRYVIIFNGEIFNYKELKEKFFPGHVFQTSSDTEVFLELFIKKGPDCFKELRGFFAAAIYDAESGELYIARDRFGKKPVHIYQDNDALLFSSELKSLIAYGIPREINYDVLPYYFQLNYIPQPLGILKGVRKLKPGHYLRVSNGEVEEHAFYTLSVKKEQYGNLTYEAAKTKLVEILDESTRLRLISDVPLGSFLSGGIDSSVIVALASRHVQQLKTFSIGYKDNPFFDETEYAQMVAKKFGTDHTVFRLSNNDFLQHIDAVLDGIDEPFADSSAIPTYILSHETRKHVTVALSGDGGDEIFAGYNKYKAEFNAMEPGIKGNLVKGLGPLWRMLPKSRNGKFTNMVRQLHRFAEGASLSATDRYWRWASMVPASETSNIFSEKTNSAIRNKGALSDLYTWNISGNDLNEVLLADMQLVLTGDMLVKVDMMSMANSLEVRSPFLDQDVVDFAFGLPAAYKINNTMKKRIVQDAFRSLLPEALYNRPKQGFDIPLLQWFRNDLWNRIDKDLLGDAFIREQGIFNPTYISALKQKLTSSNPEDAHETIWALVVFQHWWKKHIAEPVAA